MYNSDWVDLREKKKRITLWIIVSMRAEFYLDSAKYVENTGRISSTP